MVSGSFPPLFPRRSKMACPSDEYCFTSICSLVAETGSSSFLLVSQGVAFENKTEDGCCCLQKHLYLVAFLDEGGVFCFCFILLRLLFAFHFAFGAFLLSPASMIRKLRTLLPRGTSTWSNTEERLWQAKETNKKVRFELEASPYTQRPWFSGGGTFPWINPRPCERGLRIDVRYVWTPQNGSFRKRIFLKTYPCARSLNYTLLYKIS